MPSIISSLWRVGEERVILMIVETKFWPHSGQKMVSSCREVGQDSACFPRWRFDLLSNNMPILLIGKLRSRENKAASKDTRMVVTGGMRR